MQHELKNEHLPDGLITQWWSTKQSNCTTKGYSPVQACIFLAFHVTAQVPSLMRWSPQPTTRKSVRNMSKEKQFKVLQVLWVPKVMKKAKACIGPTIELTRQVVS